MDLYCTTHSIFHSKDPFDVHQESTWRIVRHCDTARDTWVIGRWNGTNHEKKIIERCTGVVTHEKKTMKMLLVGAKQYSTHVSTNLLDPGTTRRRDEVYPSWTCVPIFSLPAFFTRRRASVNTPLHVFLALPFLNGRPSGEFVCTTRT